MTANELRSKYIEFFKSKNHVEISGQSLIPENDPSVLFTTAGMHPLCVFSVTSGKENVKSPFEMGVSGDFMMSKEFTYGGFCDKIQPD